MNIIDKIIEILDDDSKPIVDQANEVFKLADDSIFARRSNAEILINLLHQAFDYTGDNNRNLLQDEAFPLSDVTEELNVEHHYRYLIAYIQRNQALINLNIEEI